MTFRWKIAQRLELRWWQTYLQGKSKEEYLEWKRNYWKGVLAMLTDTITIHSSMSICDLGCGPAGIFIALPGNQITAIDPLIEKYESQLAFFRRTVYPNTTFIPLSIEDFEAGKYDLVFCMNAINHVYDIEK